MLEDILKRMFVAEEAYFSKSAGWSFTVFSGSKSIFILNGAWSADIIHCCETTGALAVRINGHKVKVLSDIEKFSETGLDPKEWYVK